MFLSRLLQVALLCFFTASMWAQQIPVQSPPAKPKVLQPARDPEAVTAVQAAIKALGGDAAIAQVQSWRAQGQSKASKEMGGAESMVTWERVGSEFRMESAAGGKSNAIVTGRGSPASVANGAGKQLPQQVTKALFVPALVGSLLHEALQDANSSIRYVERSKLGGKDVTVVRTASMQPGDTYVVGRTWYLDISTGLPLRVEYGIPSVQTTQVWYQAAVNLSDYRSVGGVQFPFKLITYQQGRELQTVTLQSVDANASIASSDFDAPAGGAQ
jgi:hypothetical protein